MSEIPMLANLIQQLGSSSSWFQKHTAPNRQIESFGVFTDTFFVPDAAQSQDSAGRLLIPAQDFVREQNIQVVFGVGGEFVTEGIIVVSIFFCTEPLVATPKWLLRLPLLLATVTRTLVSQGKLYPTDPSPHPEPGKSEPGITFAKPRPGQVQLRREVIRLARQYLQIAGRAALVAQLRKLGSALRRRR